MLKCILAKFHFQQAALRIFPIKATQSFLRNIDIALLALSSPLLSHQDSNTEVNKCRLAFDVGALYRAASPHKHWGLARAYKKVEEEGERKTTRHVTIICAPDRPRISALMVRVDERQ